MLSSKSFCSANSIYYAQVSLLIVNMLETDFYIHTKLVLKDLNFSPSNSGNFAGNSLED